MKVWLGKDIQTKLAAAGLFIPMVKGTAEAIQNPFFKGIATEVAESDWIEIAMDQLLGPDTGLVFNDESAAVAAGSVSPADAAKAIESALERNKQQ
jgi:raffinose/stachyose/melibiose transport system substrate-binding protein